MPTAADGAVGPAPLAPAPEHPGIVVSGVRRHFGAVRAVDGVDLVARRGAVTALIGPNGSGKTTLLLVLAGLLVPDAGTVRIAGHDPVTAGLTTRALTGWMPDAFGTWDSLTAREVLTTVGAAYRLPAARAAARAAELLDLVHLTDLADRPAHVLSRGQKQRLGLARALVHDPQVLLLDEPASGLDPRSRVDLRVLVRDLAAQGKTILVSSHVLVELDEMADDAVFVSAGRTVAAESLAAASAARRPWRLRALSQSGLAGWLTAAGVPWRPEGGTANGFAPPPDLLDSPGSLVVDLDGEAGAADLLRAAVGAGVPVTSLAPASGALEATYLALEEERR
ncbi:ABC transporter ATP-binding protein [Actinotalea sp. K2]|uniref:ABC transporter ATP-binding protein n=1 Tax=Actinotalea sp. K2 TaxID=2939438 RepID=UPI0020175A5C|nr:ABC transporter ATP-binding protein [Actinotalea sp. K2]MCL3859582.1 ABC transporter ATP-binding protein [Actinotalea sp. K2]